MGDYHGEMICSPVKPCNNINKGELSLLTLSEHSGIFKLTTGTDQ